MRMQANRMVALLVLAAGTAVAAGSAGLAAVVRKPSVTVLSQPDFKAAPVGTLARNAPVQIAGQQGLWFKVAMPDGASGFVRVNDVRVASAGTAKPENMRVVLTGKAGKGRVSETAGVRGLDESALRSAAFDGAQLARLEGFRATPEAAAAAAAAKGWGATTVALAGEAKPTKNTVKQADGRKAASGARGLLGSIGLGGGAVGSLLGAGEKMVPKSEQELLELELALGPEIAGRVLGARPLLDDAEAQKRINLVGRWVASQTTRPELPWTFGVIDSPEVNAFAAPGGYVLVTRGLYELVASDAELAGVLGHEISHIVQRDHYTVIRKQDLVGIGKDLAMTHVDVGGSLAANLAKGYVARHGASILVFALDRAAEYRSDEASQVYLARSGMNPLALYAVMQKMAANGRESAGLAQLYRSHPPLDERLDRIDGRGDAALQAYITRE
jgi:Zn-dependent protease with chaperone function